MKKFCIEGDNSLQFSADAILRDLLESRISLVTIVFNDWHNNLGFEYCAVTSVLGAELSSSVFSFNFELEKVEERSRILAILFLVLQLEWGCNLFNSNSSEEALLSIHDTIIFADPSKFPNFCKLLPETS